MTHNYSFNTQLLTFKPLQHGDIEDLMITRNQNRLFFVNKEIIDIAEQETWFNNYLAKKNDIMFSIYNKKDQRIGFAALYNIDSINLVAEFGRLLIKNNFKGKNYGGFVVEAIIDFCVKTLDIHNIICKCLKNNEKALSIYLKRGFVIVGEENELIILERIEK